MQTDSINVVVAGAGRMGQAVAKSIDAQTDLALVGVWSRNANLDELLRAADVIIDFSLPDGTEVILDAVSRLGVPLICGVSGLTAEQFSKVDKAATKVPLVYDRNMSLGIAVLERCVWDAAASLGQDFAIRIAETHHVHKKDAPSGTALKLGDAIAESRSDLSTDSIQFDVERRGDVPGDHEVTMSSSTERLTFSHSVTTRQVFADGALRAARWVIDQVPGRYRMRDVLFSNVGKGKSGS